MKTEQKIIDMLLHKKHQLTNLVREIETLPPFSWSMSDAYIERDIIYAEISLLEKILETN